MALATPMAGRLQVAALRDRLTSLLRAFGLGGDPSEPMEITTSDGKELAFHNRTAWQMLLQRYVQGYMLRLCVEALLIHLGDTVAVVDPHGAVHHAHPHAHARRATWADLPTEVVEHVAAHIDSGRTLATFACVERRTRDAAAKEDLWRQRMIAEFPETPRDGEEPRSWRAVYRYMSELYERAVLGRGAGVGAVLDSLGLSLPSTMPAV
ncbi:unnamed protein product [Pedinophyceae sp. YPF-701]|nr:unnamed protein product [Pedinophyceae sp. YPF-701]